MQKCPVVWVLTFAWEVCKIINSERERERERENHITVRISSLEYSHIACWRCSAVCPSIAAME